MAILQNYPPYALRSDKRASITRLYGNGHSGLDVCEMVWNGKTCTVFDGKIINVYKSATLGNCVEYASSNGRVIVKYYHLANSCVKVGQSVSKNILVGYEGSTGSLCRGRHLHTTILVDGIQVDPLPYFNGSKSFPLEISSTQNTKTVTNTQGG